MEAYRQGDVVLKKCRVKGVLPKKVAGLVLAQGTVTGHSHRIVNGKATLYSTKTPSIMCLRIDSKTAKLFHEEHEDVDLPRGEYSVEIQREYDWFNEEVRNVAD